MLGIIELSTRWSDDGRGRGFANRPPGRIILSRAKGNGTTIVTLAFLPEPSGLYVPPIPRKDMRFDTSVYAEPACARKRVHVTSIGVSENHTNEARGLATIFETAVMEAPFISGKSSQV